MSQSMEWMKKTYKEVTCAEIILWNHISTFGEMDLYPILNGKELWPLKPFRPSYMENFVHYSV